MTISAGADTHYACFLTGLKLDLYQPKYDSFPSVFTMSPCPPGTGVVDKYGVGTKFEYERRDKYGRTGNSGTAQYTITQCSFTSGGTGIVVLEHVHRALGKEQRYVFTHTTTTLSNGDCQYTMAVDGFIASFFREYIVKDLIKLKAFVEANEVAICDEVRKKTATTSAALPVDATAANLPTAFCRTCGAANPDSAFFCGSCGASTTGGAAAPVAVAEAFPVDLPVATAQML